MTSEPHDRVWELMEKFHIAMLITTVGTEVHARPMGATVSRKEDAIYFFTNVDSQKASDMAVNPNVTLLFVDDDGQKYVSLKGRGEVLNDRSKIKELWTPFVQAWWDGPDDPEVRLVKITPATAEYWDSPGTIASYAKMLAAAVTGAQPKVGDNKTVVL